MARRDSVPATDAPAGQPDTLESRLRFAVDHEGIDLALLAATFRVTPPDAIASVVRRTPTGIFARRLWFLYEWITGRTLDLPEPAGRLRFVPVLDPARQVALKVGSPSGRHRVVDNLPGTRRFCPMVRWTPALRTASTKRWDMRIRRIIASTNPDRRAAVATWLQRNDAEASFVLAGEATSELRTARWADAIGQAGARVLTLGELLRLQRVACHGAPPRHLGLRSGRGTEPADSEDHRGSHAGARAEDLDDLVGGLIDYAERALRGGVDAVVAGAAVSFGFRHIHPLVIGNDHLHRWLVHHALDASGYTPPGFVLPISTAMIRRLEAYRDVSRAPRGATADAYRFADMTRQAEFLYTCLEDSVETDLRNGKSLAAGS